MTPTTILLVDDDMDCRMLMRDIISDCPAIHTVYEVGNGEEAMDLLCGRGDYAGSSRPDLIFLDIEMPRMDGLETLRRIRSHPELRDVPVVMMTGVTDERQMHQAAVNGANSYTLKPANASQFLRLITSSLHYWLQVHQYPAHPGGNIAHHGSAA